jgi:hypothetical protein
MVAMGVPGDPMSFGVYSDGYKGMGGCWMTVLWLVSGPFSCISILRLSLAWTSKVVQASYLGRVWRFAQDTDPISYKIALIVTLILFIGSTVFFLSGLYKIYRFFTAPPMP